VPEKGSKRNLDPSRRLEDPVGDDGADTPAAGPDGPVGPPDFADAGRWRYDAAEVVLPPDKQGCK